MLSFEFWQIFHNNFLHAWRVLSVIGLYRLRISSYFADQQQVREINNDGTLLSIEQF